MPVAWELVVRARFVEPAAAVMVTEVELVVCQLKVTLWPDPIDVGLAVNCVICGGAGGATVTFAVCGELVPPGPVATAV